MRDWEGGRNKRERESERGRRRERKEERVREKRECQSANSGERVIKVKKVYEYEKPLKNWESVLKLKKVLESVLKVVKEY